MVAPQNQPSADATPVYRLLNTATNTHLDTLNDMERAALLENAAQFRDEGVAFSAFVQDSGPEVPLYRFFNIRTGVHFFTANEGERSAILGTMAWMQPEGIACYVL